MDTNTYGLDARESYIELPAFESDSSAMDLCFSHKNRPVQLINVADQIRNPNGHLGLQDIMSHCVVFLHL